MKDETRSVSFERAAEFYDETRVTDEESLQATLDLLEDELRSRGRVLEIGVGTGALALPLAARGIPVVGVDLAATMMRKLLEKAARRPPVLLVQGDAARLPFPDAEFGGAYVRWVLHLIPNWRGAVSELCRVVAPGGSVVVEPGGARGLWKPVMERTIAEIGEAAAPVGLDMRDGDAALDEAFAEAGAARRDLPVHTMPLHGSLSEYFGEARRRVYSWTWNVPPEVLDLALERVRVWAAAEFCDLDSPLEQEAELAWRAYDLG